MNPSSIWAPESVFDDLRKPSDSTKQTNIKDSIKVESKSRKKKSKMNKGENKNKTPKVNPIGQPASLQRPNLRGLEEQDVMDQDKNFALIRKLEDGSGFSEDNVELPLSDPAEKVRESPDPNVRPIIQVGPVAHAEGPGKESKGATSKTPFVESKDPKNINLKRATPYIDETLNPDLADDIGISGIDLSDSDETLMETESGMGDLDDETVMEGRELGLSLRDLSEKATEYSIDLTDTGSQLTPSALLQAVNMILAEVENHPNKSVKRFRFSGMKLIAAISERAVPTFALSKLSPRLEKSAVVTETSTVKSSTVVPVVSKTAESSPALVESANKPSGSKVAPKNAPAAVPPKTTDKSESNGSLYKLKMPRYKKGKEILVICPKDECSDLIEKGLEGIDLAKAILKMKGVYKLYLYTCDYSKITISEE